MVSARSVFVLISFSGLLGSIGCKREPSTPQKTVPKTRKLSHGCKRGTSRRLF